MMATDFIQFREKLNQAATLSRTLAICKKSGIGLLRHLRHIKRVKATTKRQTRTEAELLDHATNNLLRAIKQDMLKKEGRVDYDKLRKEGYSDRLITGLKHA